MPLVSVVPPTEESGGLISCKLGKWFPSHYYIDQTMPPSTVLLGNFPVSVPYLLIPYLSTIPLHLEGLRLGRYPD